MCAVRPHTAIERLCPPVHSGLDAGDNLRVECLTPFTWAFPVAVLRLARAAEDEQLRQRLVAPLVRKVERRVAPECGVPNVGSGAEELHHDCQNVTKAPGTTVQNGAA